MGVVEVVVEVGKAEKVVEKVVEMGQEGEHDEEEG